jgi:hypothetical protein
VLSCELIVRASASPPAGGERTARGSVSVDV